MKPWQKAVIGIAVIVVPGSILIGGAYGIYRMIRAKNQKKLQENPEIEKKSQKEIENG